ncbi:MAG: hypothetical protein CMN30_18755 [Sandaracinus sp.]|nr:hypothetical protein [Sandaracinus sp.]
MFRSLSLAAALVSLFAMVSAAEAQDSCRWVLRVPLDGTAGPMAKPGRPSLGAAELTVMPEVTTVARCLGVTDMLMSDDPEALPDEPVVVRGLDRVDWLRLDRFKRYVTRDGLSLLDLLAEAGRPLPLDDDLDLAAAPRYGGPFVSVRAEID